MRGDLLVSKGMKRVIKILTNNRNKTIQKRVKEDREYLEQLATLVELPKDVKIEKVDVNGIPSAWLTMPESIDNNVLLYLHGGGYVTGSITSHQDLVMRISRVSKMRALIIEYRLAPENPFPAAVEDALKAYKWLIEKEGINPQNTIIAGDSAGGGLTLATLIKIRDNHLPMPAAGITLSPWTDLAHTGNSITTKAQIDPFITVYDLIFDANLYLGDAHPQNPLVSPLYADLKGLPPLLIQVGTDEILLDDSTRFAERAEEAGVNVQLDVWQDMIHVFQAFADWAPEGQEAIEKIGQYIQNRIN